MTSQISSSVPRARAMSRSRSALRAASVAAASVLLCAPSASACTNLLVSQGASHDASTILAYNADSGSLYGSLGHYPATDNNPPNATREVWDWDDSVFLGVIPEARRTFNVIGNANERGLVIGETTFGGLPELDCHGTGGVMDYGSLIWIALQRAETCAEAIDVIDSLVQTYGYASDGESFSCVDGAEAWLMELVGKGERERGAVWVATRVPEGAVLAHANQARTTTFDMNDPVNVRYSPDVVSFARAIGRYPVDASDDDFDFSAAYDPVTFGGARHGDARVWDIYRRLEGEEAMEPYREYARGYNLTNRLPLFAYPAARLDVESAMAIMRTKLEDTWFDTRGTHRADVGAGPGHSAYRFRPLTWRDSAGRAFVNERTVATQQTAWNFVAESRLRFPKPIAAIQWWAPDDSGTALRVPVYGGAARVPYNFADAVGQVPAAAVDAGNAPDADASRPSLDSAFWIWNLAASLAYGERADVVAPLLARELDREQSRLLRLARDADAELAGVVEQELVEAATTFVEKVAADAFARWRDVFLKLFAATRDGFLITPSDTPRCVPGKSKVGCTARAVPNVAEIGYDAEWRDRVAADGENAKRYAAPPDGGVDDATKKTRAYESWKRARMEKRRPRMDVGLERADGEEARAFEPAGGGLATSR